MQIRAYFELVRLPNILTAVADPLAGYLFVGGLLSDWQQYLPILGCSAFMYAGGIALNDICDAQKDRRTRPARPIPSGRISASRALLFVGALFAMGIYSAALHGAATLVMAIGLLATIVAYDAVFKDTPGAPALMGVCRALNLGLGMVSRQDVLISWEIAVAAILMWMYISSLTWFARTEFRKSRRRDLRLALIGIILAISGQACLHAIIGETDRAQLAMVLVMVILAWRYGHGALRNTGPERTQRAVTMFLLGIVCFDASLVWITRGFSYGCVVIAFLIPAALLARIYKMT